MTYWSGKTRYGKIVNEMNDKWNEIENDLVEIEFHVTNKDGTEQIISLPKNMKYNQFKSASAGLGDNKVEIESRVLGIDLGNNIVNIRVNEKTNNISLEIK